jgi:hypothetical protein
VQVSATAPLVPDAPAAPSTVHDLRTLVLSRHPAIQIDTVDEERAEALIANVASALGIPAYEWTVTRGLAPLGQAGGMYGSDDPAKALGNIEEILTDALYVLKDFGPHLSQPAISRRFRDLVERFSGPAHLSTFVLLGTGCELPPEVRPHVVTYELQPPTRDEYRATIEAVVRSLTVGARARVELSPEDCEALAAALHGLTLNQARQLVARVAIDDGVLSSADIPRLIDLKAGALREDGLLEYFPAEDNPTELGGFANLRRWLDRSALARSPQAAALNVPAPRGMLLVGVQGCGKSLAAKYVARAWRLPLVKLDAGRLYDKYVGETEKNLRRAIATVESLAPAVLWMDEIEKALAPSGGEDGGVSRRMLGSFLTWMQEKHADVFVVATANDLSILPPELLRKGRFDEIFFVDLPDPPEREEILRIHLRLRRQDPAAFDLPALCARADGFSGAEIEQAVIGAVLRALQAGRPLDSALLAEELGATVPLSRSRAEDIQRLRSWAQGRFVPVRH